MAYRLQIQMMNSGLVQSTQNLASSKSHLPNLSLAVRNPETPGWGTMVHASVADRDSQPEAVMHVTGRLIRN